MAKKKPVSNDPLDVNSLGDGIKMLDKQDVRLSPALARKFLEELHEFRGERNAREHWVDNLAKEMRRGTFRWEHVILAKASLNGEDYRVNGQHTCWARLEFEDDPSFTHAVTLIRYEVKTEEDLRNLYTSFDQHGIRTRGHVVMAQLVDYCGWKDVSKGAITYVSRGFPLWRWEEEKERRLHDARDHAFLLQTEFLDLGVKVGRFLTEKAVGVGVKHLHRAPVVAAMLGSFAKNAAAAEEFWLPVADGAGLRALDPRNKLRAELLASAVGVGKSTSKKTLTQEQMLRMCIYAWNAHRAGEERVNLRGGFKGPRPKFR